MKKKAMPNFTYSIGALFLTVILLSSVRPVVAQQRSPYDLAAWIIAAVDTYDTATANWAYKKVDK